MHGFCHASVWQVRDTIAYVRRKQRHVVGLGVLHERRCVHANRDSKVRQRRHADLQQQLSVGDLHGPDLRRAADSGVRDVRDAVAYVRWQHRQPVELVSVRYGYQSGLHA